MTYSPDIQTYWQAYYKDNKLPLNAQTPVVYEEFKVVYPNEHDLRNSKNCIKKTSEPF